MSHQSSVQSLSPPDPIDVSPPSHWTLDPTFTFLNHGSFGACPESVLQVQDGWRRELERRPVEFLDRRRMGLLAEARGRLGAFLDADPDDLGFVTNATGGVNAVIRSLPFETGNEILTTNHVYPAVDQTLGFIAKRTGATYVKIDLPLPLAGPEAVLKAIEAKITDRTRLVQVDHVTSPSALVLPVGEIVNHCAARGIDVLIDGAHAPGMLDLSVASLGAAYYAGNLHKWVCAPKGAAFLWVRRDRQAGIHPTTLSTYLDQGFVEEFGWQGTRDITPWLSVSASIDFMAGFGWDRVKQHNHRMAIWAQAMFCDRLGIEPLSPIDGSMLGSMVAWRLPAAARRFENGLAFQAALYDRHQIEIPVFELGDQWLLRASCQIYNRAEEYERLAEAVLELIA